MRTELKRETKTRTITAVSEKKEGGKSIEFVTKEEVYSPLSDAFQSEIDRTWRIRKRKTVPPVLPAVKGWYFNPALTSTNQ